jgi:hypothetical protein
MKEKDTPGKNWGQMASRTVFTLLAAGFVTISVWNGYIFYEVLFGLSMAILISGTFEVARFACLISFIGKGKRIGTIAAVVYVVIASACAFAAINSFTYEVIKRDRAGQIQNREQIHAIKKAYSRMITEKITAIDRDITYIERKMAMYHGRVYWKRRLSQAVINREKLITERDDFLNETPENLEQWIKAKSAMLGLEMENPSSDSEEMISVTLALQELWSIEKATAQKIMGIVITVTVEMSIILLSFLASAERKSRSVIGVTESREPSRMSRVVTESRGVTKGQENHGRPVIPAIVTKSVTTREELLNEITLEIDEITIEKFTEANREHFEKTGGLLPMRKLSMSLRPVRKILEDFDRESIAKLFEK